MSNKTKTISQPKVIQIAQEICTHLKTTGIGGVRFRSTKVQPELTWDDVYDEMTKKEYDAMCRNRVYFIVDDCTIYDSNWGRQENDYTSEDVDEAGFYRDVVDYVSKRFGDGFTVDFSKGCGEFEILNKKWLEKQK